MIGGGNSRCYICPSLTPPYYFIAPLHFEGRIFLMKGVCYMAKSKVDKWLTPEGLTLIQGWARDGLVNEQIAHNMGISAGCLYEYIKKYDEINEALKKGKEVVDYEVENALIKAALDGNTTAQIFFLKNRRPDKWRDKRDVDVTTSQMEKLDKILESVAQDADIHGKTV